LSDQPTTDTTVAAPASMAEPRVEKPVAPNANEIVKAKEDYEAEAASYATDKNNDAEIEIRERESVLDLRERYADKAYQFVRSAVLGVIALVGADLFLKALFYGYGFVVPHSRHPSLSFTGIDSSIVIALISGVTVNVLAVFLIVIRNLFPKK